MHIVNGDAFINAVHALPHQSAFQNRAVMPDEPGVRGSAGSAFLRAVTGNLLNRVGNQLRKSLVLYDKGIARTFGFKVK